MARFVHSPKEILNQQKKGKAMTVCQIMKTTLLLVAIALVVSGCHFNQAIQTVGTAPGIKEINKAAPHILPISKDRIFISYGKQF